MAVSPVGLFCRLFLIGACLPVPAYLTNCLPTYLPTYLPDWLPICMPTCLLTYLTTCTYLPITYLLACLPNHMHLPSGFSSRKGNLGHEEDPDCESQNEECAVTKPKIDIQCSQSDDLMETEEIKSKGDLDPALECSEQMNASTPASTPGLCDKESLIDDISTDISERIYESLHPVFMDTKVTFNNEVSNSVIKSVGSIQQRKKKRNKTSAICG